MSRNLISISPDFPSLFRISSPNQTRHVPFAREIFLLACHIAGTNFRPEIAQLEPQLKPGEKLRLQREPQNKFDPLAVAVYDARDNHLGYLPKSQNPIPARLLDAGKILFARLTTKEWQDSWLKLDIEIYLND